MKLGIRTVPFMTEKVRELLFRFTPCRSCNVEMKEGEKIFRYFLYFSMKTYVVGTH